MHDLEIFIFSFGTCQERLGRRFLGEESALGFNFCNIGFEMAFCREPLLDHVLGQLGLFIKFGPPFYFKGSLDDQLGFMSVKLKTPHPDPR